MNMRVLVLTSSTGGGHDMRARSFKAWAECHADFPVETRIHQTLESTHPLYRFGVALYNGIQKYQPRLHHLYFGYLEVAAMFKNASRILSANRSGEVLAEFRPSVILSVHGSLNHGFFDLAKQTLGADAVRCGTYCGELHDGYGFSKHWVNPQADFFVAATEQVRQGAIRRGVPSDRAFCGGFLLSPDFYTPEMDAASRAKFLYEATGLDPARFTILLSTGAVGANNHLSFLKALAKSGLSCQAVALCGKNDVAREKISAWAQKQSAIKVAALPTFQKMSNLMQSVSAIVARPGTGTTSEAIVRGCPILFNGLGGVMPQECITLQFALEKNWNTVLRRPENLPQIIRPWIDAPCTLKAAQAHMRQLQTQGHPSEVVRVILGQNRR